MAILTSDPRAASAFSESVPCALISVHRDDYNAAIAKVHLREVNERIGYLRKIHIFRGWNMDRLEDLAKSLSSEVYASGDVIMRQGKDPIGIYFIRGGRVRHLFRLDKTSIVLEIASLGKYEYFGEREVIVPGVKDYGSIVAETDVELLFLSTAEFGRKFTISAVREMEARISQYATFDEMISQFADELKWEKYKKDLVNDM